MVLLLCLLPLTARADAGTPLMWAGMLHLAFGNAVIGVLEGLLLAKFCKLKNGQCVGVMILANYFSSWGGGLFLAGTLASHLSLNLYNAWFWFWIMVGITFLLTLILEWPFVFFCLRRQPGRFKKSLGGNLLVNSISYVLLFGWYWMASGTGLYRNMHIVHPSQMAMPTNGVVFFISATNGDVYSQDLSQGKTEKVFALHTTNKDDRLLVLPAKSDAQHWDILEYSNSITICSNLSVTAAACRRDTYGTPSHGTWFNFGEAPKLGAATNSDWTFQTGFWSVEGLRGRNAKTGVFMHFSLETPFVAWIARSATQLPDDYVIFQLGEDQICLLQATTKKITLLNRGYGPVVILKNNP